MLDCSTAGIVPGHSHHTAGTAGQAGRTEHPAEKSLRLDGNHLIAAGCSN